MASDELLATDAIWVEFAHFVSYHLASYPNPYPNPNPNPDPDPDPDRNPNPNPNPNPKLGGLFHKMCELYLFSVTDTGAWYQRRSCLSEEKLYT